MGFQDGRIVLNSDSGIYYSGQTIFGKLIFDQAKDKVFRGIYAKLKGSCYVHWRTSHTRTVDGKTETYYVDHTSQEEYVDQKTYLIGSDRGECKIPPGHYEYPFQLVIPSSCPSSYEGTIGHIRYTVKVVVDRAFKLDQEKKVALRVIAPLDLNTEPGVKDPIQIKFDETYYCCCTRSGSVTAVVKLPYGGFVPGQTIPLEVGCDNRGGVTIDSFTFTLRREVVFHAQGTREEKADMAKLQLGEVLANTSRNFMAELLVPSVDAPNVRNCRYIDINYWLKVTMSPDGCHSDGTQSRKIVIGTIPLAGSNYSPNAQEQLASQNEPVVSQPLASHYPERNSPYPGPAPYPGADPYPSNTPYPGPMVTPYPPNNPYPIDSGYPPYPPPYSASPSGDSSFPPDPTPYPKSNISTEKAPYPVVSSVTPVPTSNSPYPTSNSPYPTSNSQFPPLAASSPFPGSHAVLAGVRTGNLGFYNQPGVNNALMPQLPQGAVPYSTNTSLNPFATATAPQPGTPDDEKK